LLIISFAWTTAVLLSGHKSCTRRNWTDEYARRFKMGGLRWVWKFKDGTGARESAAGR